MTSDKNLPWIQDVVGARRRGWEEFYRNRWQYDKVVRSVNMRVITPDSQLSGDSRFLAAKGGAAPTQQVVGSTVPFRAGRVAVAILGLWPATTDAARRRSRFR